MGSRAALDAVAKRVSFFIGAIAFLVDNFTAAANNIHKPSCSWTCVSAVTSEQEDRVHLPARPFGICEVIFLASISHFSLPTTNLMIETRYRPTYNLIWIDLLMLEWIKLNVISRLWCLSADQRNVWLVANLVSSAQDSTKHLCH
jgi:hypothetical protein